MDPLKALSALAKRHGTRPIHACCHVRPDGAIRWPSQHLLIDLPAQHSLTNWPAEGVWLPIAELAQAACTGMEYVAGALPTVRAGSSILRPLVGEDSPSSVRPGDGYPEDCGSFATQDLAAVFRAADREGGNAVLGGVHLSPTHMEATDGKSLFRVSRMFDACPSVILPPLAVEALCALGKGGRWVLTKGGMACRAQSQGIEVAFRAVDGTYPAVAGAINNARGGVPLNLGPAAAALASRKWAKENTLAIIHATGCVEDSLGEWGVDTRHPLALGAPLGVNAVRLAEAVAFAGTGACRIGRGILFRHGDREALVMPITLANPDVRPRQTWPAFAGKATPVRKAAPDEVTRLRAILDAHGIAY